MARGGATGRYEDVGDGGVGDPSAFVEGEGGGGVRDRPRSVREKKECVRTRHTDKWEVNMSKKKSNLGEQYGSYKTMTVMAARKIGHLVNTTASRVLVVWLILKLFFVISGP